VFRGTSQRALIETVILSASLVKGNTTFKPPDYEFKLSAPSTSTTPGWSRCVLLNIDPQKRSVRTDSHFGVQEAFVDKHLRNVSDRYDFDSMRVGIQPFISDFRGFVQRPALRRAPVRQPRQQPLAIQPGLVPAAREGHQLRPERHRSRRLRDDDIFVANAFRQDWPVLGHTTQAT
jgi:hypothetical protein